MSEMNICSGDVITFTAVQWKEDDRRTKSPTMLLTPVAHIYEDGIDLETAINEALVDVRTDGKLRDMTFERFLSERGWNLKYLKHIAHSAEKTKKKIDKNYRVLKATYRFWRDENGDFQYANLSHRN